MLEQSCFKLNKIVSTEIYPASFTYAIYPQRFFLEKISKKTHRNQLTNKALPENYHYNGKQVINT